MKFANIIVDISLEKLDRTFQYRVPEELQGILKEGMQVPGSPSETGGGAADRLRAGADGYL